MTDPTQDHEGLEAARDKAEQAEADRDYWLESRSAEIIAENDKNEEWIAEAVLEFIGFNDSENARAIAEAVARGHLSRGVPAAIIDISDRAMAFYAVDQAIKELADLEKFGDY